MTAGCSTSAGLKTFLMVWMLAVLALRIASGQGQAGGNPTTDVPREIVLQPSVAPFVLEVLNVDLAKPTQPFRREPETSSHHVFRSVLHFGQDTNNPIALIWDQPRQKLYLDLNRNLDLTDDPGGVFTSANAGLSQTFTNVLVPVETATGSQPVVLGVQCFAQTNAGSAWARLSSRSFWQAKVTIAGQEWQVAALDHLSGLQNPSAGQFLLLRPWAARTNQMSLYDTTSGIVPFPRRLFWLGQAFQLERQFDTSGAIPVCRLELTPQQPPLAELNLSGDFLYYAVLRDTNGYTAILGQPWGKLRLPQGNYAVNAVWLKKGPTEAFKLTYDPMVLKTATTTNLTLGGPLTNCVVLDRTGRNLQMNYQLRGADGRYYRLAEQDRTRPPEFTVFYGGKKALAVKFEFG
jgi:hypothetical protein